MLHNIAEIFEKKKETISDFFAREAQGLTPPLYLSCDIRSSGRKLGVIDTNLFPAGYNNLCNSYSRKTALAFKKYFDNYLPQVRKIILLIEEHTRNRFYLENVQRLNSLLEAIGLETRIAYLGQEIPGDSLDVTLADGTVLHLEKLHAADGAPRVKNFEADWVISNNDFSQGIPEVLLPILKKILPSPGLGWHQRRKSTHFSILQGIVDRFSQILDLDPWLLGSVFQAVENLDLNKVEDISRLASGVEQTLSKTRKYYEQYGIEDNPYVFVKNDAGTYGMGLIDVFQPDEILQMNRRMKNKLLSAKGGQKVDSFLIQEGIPTADFYSGLPIEPVIYMVGFDVVGGFFRMNAERDALSSLNTRGMVFSCLCLHKLDEPHERDFLNCAEKENLVRLSSVMAKLAALAAAREMQLINQQALNSKQAALA